MTLEQEFFIKLKDFSKRLEDELEYTLRESEKRLVIETRTLQFFNEMEKLKNAQREQTKS